MYTCTTYLLHEIFLGSCRSAGFVDCCHGGDCQGIPRNCFCDVSCYIMNDCCDDLPLICEGNLKQLRANQSCGTIFNHNYTLKILAKLTLNK